jgi:magnesium-transporting ATPase (P-type)
LQRIGRYCRPDKDPLPPDAVPADLQILHEAGLSAEESILTGESVAVEKRVRIHEFTTPLAEKKNMLFAGTTVLSGIAIGFITSIGSGTKVGMLVHSVSMTTAAKPPLSSRTRVRTVN